MKQIQPIQRTCMRCGNPLPENASKNRKYCLECATIVNREKSKEKNRNYVAKRKEKTKAKQAYIDLDRSKLDPDDRAYCDPCIYSNQHSWQYLCNFYTRTGQRRGCKAGVGCVRRELRSK